MTSAIFSTAYFPPISYFVALQPYKNIFIEAHENYQKQSYRNRAYIAGPNGKQSLNIPIIKTTGNHTLIKKITLDKETSWRHQHWHSIETAYNSSPFLMYYEQEIKAVLFKGHNNLWHLNWDILVLMLELFQIDTKPIETTNFVSPEDKTDDFRNKIHPKRTSIIENGFPTHTYYQVFEDRNGFIKDLSCLDILFNLGPQASEYIKSFHI